MSNDTSHPGAPAHRSYFPSRGGRRVEDPSPARHPRTTDAIAPTNQEKIREVTQGARNKNQSSSSSSDELSSASSLNMKSFWYSIRNCVLRFRSTKRP